MNLNEFKSFKCLKNPIKKHDLIKLQIEIMCNQIKNLQIEIICNQIKNLPNPEHTHEEKDIFELFQLADEIDLDRASFMKVMDILDLAVKGCDNL